MLATLDVKLNDTGFKISLALVGAGAGLLASQLGNIIMSSVASEKSSEAGGLQGTAQNLGSSLGTALIGAVLLASLATGFSNRIVNDPNVPAAAQKSIAANTEKGIDIFRSAPLSRRRATVGPRRSKRVRSPPTTAPSARCAAALPRSRGGRGTAVAVVHSQSAGPISRRQRGGGHRRTAARPGLSGRSSRSMTGTLLTVPRATR